ncbi:alpha-amylase family protein [Draconibacterium sediminis]|uniref:Beta-galactosidase trimerisation domain-containing protein n=1 Tax=Draconibacterium sediminis TaxID=1544798 RepID=A0A0D8JHQ7_9BACT|nr:hypothetical protein [Draconibacterium sediminis]KJF45383.1 hypothetical protein LH29_08430 [Draconibacterium sediminis]
MNLIRIILLIPFFCAFINANAQKSGLFTEGSRQVHLDFHTTEKLENIGKDWNKENWQQTLKVGHVNSINIFAKGHHGWCYYNTEVGKRHPNLDFDLFKAQLEACHEIGVTAQAYVTVGWNVLDAHEHPEWVSTGKDGKNQFAEMEANAKPGEPFPWGWPTLSPEGGYLEHLLKHTEEIAKNYEVDGFWFDIVPVGSINYNEWSKKDMEANGVDWNNEKEAWAHHCKKMHAFFQQTNAVIKKYRPNATIYYNWTTGMNDPRILKEAYYQYNTKQDLEDLPTTWAGYDVFPVRAKFYANTGKPIVAMSGKFHSAWGEFGGFKHKNAIWYEAVNMLSFGAMANFGDQLHPTGKLEKATYDNIGYAYSYIEKIEKYCVDAKQLAKTAVWLNFSGKDNDLTRMLLEHQVNFVVANNLKDWSAVDVLILHSGVRLNEQESKQIKEFVDNGGKLLIIGKGAFEDGKWKFDIGAKYLGESNYQVDYTLVSDKLNNNLVQSPFLNRNPAIRVEPENETEILAQIYEPYFDRTVEHWTSHDNVPYQTTPATHPAVIRKGNIVWCAHDLETIYSKEGSQVHRQLFFNALSQLLSDPLVKVEMPSCGRLNLLHQPRENRYVVHLTYGTPHKRGRAQVIEDLVPLYNVPVSVDFDEKIKKAYTIPGKQSLKMNKVDGKLHIVVPEFKCHTAVVFEY